MKILGIDPGLASVGWGVIEHAPPSAARHVAHGVIKTRASESTPARVEAIARQLGAVLATYEPDTIASEQYLNYGRVLWNGIQTLYSIGALIALAAGRGHRVWEYSAKAAKTGIGVTDGEKASVQKRVAELLALDEPVKPEHAADALAVALTHARFYSAGVVIADRAASRKARR